jgi:hypothetical protein
MSYVKISEFGKQAAYAPVNHPLSYIMSGQMDSSLMHGSDRINDNSRESAIYAAEYCAKGFDKFCEVMVSNPEPQYFPEQIHGYTYNGNNIPKMMTKGDVVLMNTAKTKYLMEMIGGSPNQVPFDPTVAASPLITVWTGEYMQPQYYIPKGLDVDSDPVMLRLLNRPLIAIDLLMNIYANMTKLGRIGELQGTKLGTFFNNMKENAKKFSDPVVSQFATSVM